MSDPVSAAADDPRPEFVRDHANPTATTIWVGGTEQSYVDLDDPRRLEFDYVQRIADLIDVMAEPGQSIRVLHIGGAGLTLPRYVATTRPRSSQIVLEPDAALTAVVRRDLPLPKRSGIRIRPVDGRTGLREIGDSRMDLVIVDAFVGSRVPAELTTVEFLDRGAAGARPRRAGRARTSPTGVRWPTVVGCWPGWRASTPTRW